MNRKFLIGFLGLALLIGLVLYLTDDAGNGSKNAIQKQYSDKWDPEYDIHSSDPRNLGFFNQLLNAHTSDSVYELNEFSDLKKIPNYQEATYLFVGEQFGLEDPRYDSILTLVDSGANLFLAFDFVTSNIYSRYFSAGAYFWDYNNALYAWIGDTTLSYPLMSQNDTVYGDWYSFDSDQILDSAYQAYAFALYEPIAFFVKQGKGKVHFHSVPRLFQNYQLLQPNGYSHAELMMRRFPKDKPIIWLEIGRISNPNAVTSNQDAQAKGRGNDKQDNSLIQYIIKSPYLRAAFLLGILLLLVYLLFRAKRREPIVGGITEKRNMSVAFVETLSSIYLSRNSPVGILQVLRKNFFATVNRHFYLDLSHKEKQEENIRRLIEKSSVDPERIHTLIASLNPRKNNVDEKHLGSVYHAIRQFYIETGISKTRSQFVAAGQTIQLSRSVWTGAFGLLFGIMFLFRGLFNLSAGAGYGVLFVLVGAICIFIFMRLLSKPLAVISATELIVYGITFGKKQYSLQQGFHCVVAKNTTTFFFEDGKTAVLNHTLLNKSGKIALAQFVQHNKQSNL